MRSVDLFASSFVCLFRCCNFSSSSPFYTYVRFSKLARRNFLWIRFLLFVRKFSIEKIEFNFTLIFLHSFSSSNGSFHSHNWHWFLHVFDYSLCFLSNFFSPFLFFVKILFTFWLFGHCVSFNQLIQILNYGMYDSNRR